MIINLYEVSRNKKSVGKQLNKNTDPVFHLALSGDVSDKWPIWLVLSHNTKGLSIYNATVKGGGVEGVRLIIIFAKRGGG